MVCPNDCTWKDWGGWSCNVTCGNGTQTRSRGSIPGKVGGLPCVGNNTESGPCTNVPKFCGPPVDCIWNGWSNWTSCPVTCGAGNETRARTQNVTAQNGGKACDGSGNDARPCSVALKPCPIDCNLTQWTDWSKCTVPCGNGTQARNRTMHLEQNGGKPCTGDNSTHGNQTCNNFVCPIDCVWLQWGNWTCSVTCGVGVQTRNRDQIPGKSGGKPCDGDSTQTTFCSDVPKFCFPPVDCNFTQWESWGHCSAPCGGGTQNRSRSQIPAQFGGKDCVGNTTESASCNTNVCSDDCQWMDWGAWSCSVTCGNGTQTRNRGNIPAKNAGLPCNGSATETGPCTNVPKFCSPPIDCTWQVWSQWGACSVTCGVGVQARSRHKNEAQFGGADCVGSGNDTKICSFAACPVDCNYTAWSEWTKCSVECAGGVQNRTRTLITAAKNGGKPCDGQGSNQTQQCNLDACPFNCTWRDWTSWKCSVTCGNGTQVRTRDQIPGKPGGAPCVGDSNQTDLCSLAECSTDCQWNDWSVWGSCSKTCGNGTQIRSRGSTPAHSGGKDCEGSNTTSRDCTLDNCPQDCEYSQWSSWTNCSLACGTGKKSRTRTIVTQPTAHGHPCDQDVESNMDCQVAPCPIDCSWGDWSDWSDCTVTCNNGTRSRLRRARGPEWGGKNCSGDPIDTETCTNPTTCKVDCQWTAWTDWSKCSTPCGTTGSGTSTRARAIYIQPENGGFPCQGQGNDTRTCEGTDSDCTNPPSSNPSAPDSPSSPGLPNVTDSGPNGGLSTGGVVGIAVGSAAAVVVVAVAVATAVVASVPPPIETV